MQAVEVGEMAKWFPEKEVPLFPYDKTYEEAEWDPVVVLHTSGSTGLPKPVVARVGMMSIGDAYRELPEFQGSKFHFNAWTDVAKSTFIPSECSCTIWCLTLLTDSLQCRCSTLPGFTRLSTYPCTEHLPFFSALIVLCRLISWSRRCKKSTPKPYFCHQRSLKI